MLSAILDEPPWGVNPQSGSGAPEMRFRSTRSVMGHRVVGPLGLGLIEGVPAGA